MENIRGWWINLSGRALPVYSNYEFSSRVGTITVNECCCDGSVWDAPWQADGCPIYFKNAAGEMAFGVLKEEDAAGLVDFSKYASNGSSWIPVSTLVRYVQYRTKAVYADGTGNIILEPGSVVWLHEDCTRGEENRNYIAVRKVMKNGSSTPIEFKGNGFVDLTYGGRWLNVGSILLRKN